MRSVLVTGGTGTFGRRFVSECLQMPDGPERIVVFSRGEHTQAEMAMALAPYDHEERLRFFIGDVRDKERLRRAFDGVEVVVHAAALKRIEVGYYNPMEMTKTNVFGTMNVVEAAMDMGVNKVVFLSSDKAHRPVSAYGFSKASAESIILAANNTRGAHGPVFAVTRYGNVWRSNGSVVPKWEAILASGKDTVPVSNPNCTRFMMRLDEAVDLVLRTIQTMKGGETMVPDLPAYRLGDLAEAMGAKMDVQGLPAWEKMHESMDDEHCSADARRMSVDELKEVLLT